MNKFIIKSGLILFMIFSVLFSCSSLCSERLVISLEDLDLFSKKDIFSVKIYYILEIPRTGYGRRSERGEIILKRNLGLVNKMVTRYSEKKDEERIKIVENFVEGINLRYDYLNKEVKKINYYSWFGKGKWHLHKDLNFNIWDIFFFSKSNLLFIDTLIKNGMEQIGNKETYTIFGALAKYPFFNKKCRIWLGKDDNFVYKFVIYNEEDRPIFTLEVTEVEINPEIDVKEFSIEIPPDFRVVDITEQFAQQYRILVDLYRVYAENENLQKRIEELEEEIGLANFNRSKETEGVSENSSSEIIQGKPSILFIEREMGFVIVGGKEEDLGIGTVFEVYRGNRLLGRIEITRVYEDMAVAEPITEGLINIIKEKDGLVKVE